MSNSNSNGNVTADQARRIMTNDARQREVACQEAIDRILTEHRCKLSFVTVIRDGTITVQAAQVRALP
jgi:hypothetical protein